MRYSPAAINVFGFGFGVLTGSTPGAGVLLLSLLLGAGLTGPGLIGTDAAIGMVVNLAKAGMFSTFGLLDLRGAALGLLIGAAMLPGAYVARMVLDRLSIHVHTAMMEVLVVVASLSFFWRAFAQ